MKFKEKNDLYSKVLEPSDENIKNLYDDSALMVRMFRIRNHMLRIDLENLEKKESNKKD